MPDRRWLLTPLLLAAACAGASVDPDAASVDDLPPAAANPADRAAALVDAEAAVAAWRSTRRTTARQLADSALARDPRCGRALALRAMLQWRFAQLQAKPPALRDVHAAEAALRQAVAAVPNDAFAGLSLAIFLADVDHLTAAAEVAERAIARLDKADAVANTVDRADLFALAAACRFELGEERAALPHLQAYVALRPDDADQQYRLGSALLTIAATTNDQSPTSRLVAQRQAEAAARAFGRAFELRPNDAAAGKAVATAFLRAADLAGARGVDGERTEALDAANATARALTALIAADPEPWWLLGVAMERGKDPIGAAAAFDEALARAPAHVPSLLHRAALADEAGDGATAKSLLQRALATDATATTLTNDERKRVQARLAQP